MMHSQSHMRVRMLTEGAILIAAAEVLSLLKLYEFPQGGSITLEMLPIFLYCIRWGLRPGLTASAAYGILQLVTGIYAWTWQSVLGDYLIPFTLLGICGVFRAFPGGVYLKIKGELHLFPCDVYLGTLAGAAARFLSHWVTGATVWAIYMPDEFFGMTMTSPWFYSLLYNGSYMILDTALCLIVFAVMEKSPLKKYLRGEDLR